MDMKDCGDYKHTEPCVFLDVKDFLWRAFCFTLFRLLFVRCILLCLFYFLIGFCELTLLTPLLLAPSFLFASFAFCHTSKLQMEVGETNRHENTNTTDTQSPITTNAFKRAFSSHSSSFSLASVVHPKLILLWHRAKNPNLWTPPKSQTKIFEGAIQYPFSGDFDRTPYYIQICISTYHAFIFLVKESDAKFELTK